MNLREMNDAINYYIRPQTFPFAIRMCESKEEIPDDALIPSQDLGHKILPCHAFTRARRFGQTVAVGKDDAKCPYGEIVLGFATPKEEFFSGDFTTGYLCTTEAAKKTAEIMPRLEYGKYKYLLTSPLDKAQFEPHIIMVYCDGAQLMRLIQGALRGKGGPITSRCMGAFGCSFVIAEMMMNDQFHYHIPGGGERMSALTQDHEVAFMAPMSRAEELIQGLKEGAEAHYTDYPIRGNLGSEPMLPPEYAALWDHLHEE